MPPTTEEVTAKDDKKGANTVSPTKSKKLHYSSSFQLHGPEMKLVNLALEVLGDLFGVPRISKILNSGEYVRTTDFTPSCIIGQFYGLALELPDNMNLPNFDEISLNYKENEENPLNLEKGNTFFS
ncbi:hypothetical protein RD792_008556 [Penstemon davidsonii]|uniref:RDR1/2-like PH-like domain-containing protein n=1 Tax=Penstemon davidsonii TaxID=160366 RepID=A0ABR0DA91_9LAMI|nr:hypothetical protein RD792_008556 [Penstemon davidsonii]